MKNKICCVLNYAPHYRQSIYRLMDKELDCDFYFGSRLQTEIRKIDYAQLNQVKELRSIWFFNKIYWMRNSIKLVFKPYRKYLVTGQINCISNWIFFLLAYIVGKEIYIWNHGWYGKETLIKRLIKKLFYYPVKGFFLYGDYAKKLMMLEGYDENKLNVVYNSLDYDRSISLRKKLQKITVYSDYFGNQNPVLIFTGRLQPVKNLDYLLVVLKNQQEKGNIWNLVLIGNGTDRDRLQQLTMDYHLKKQVWFYGSCYDEEKLSNLFYNADICVSPGNVGLTAIHSFSYGTPVITHDAFPYQMPEFEGIISGKTGDFFCHDDITSLQIKIEEWLHKHPKKDSNISKFCFEVVDYKYNPLYQIRVMKEILVSSCEGVSQ